MEAEHMPLINVMRHIASEQGMSDYDFDVSLSAYIGHGTLTEAERQQLLAMAPTDRSLWLVAERRYPIDALRAVVLDFNAHGYLTVEGLARFDQPTGEPVTSL
ncbi:hypothetical protein [Mycobacterium sp.]|jgi:hypothetical protein|uniref:hypothetical protein n=1 Tax=Mycobacterium sp. TaxID=1785 RepID=UPI0028BE4D45|nr:hypothetical protein [Mycobacterium sp.]